MLEYLIPSTTRRRLLHTLFVDGEAATVSSLARRADVSTASAYTELQAMHRAGFARHRLTSGQRIYEAANDHPHAETIRSLLAMPVGDSSLPAEDAGAKDDANTTRNDLAAIGAKLRGHRPSVRTSTPLEQNLANGVVLAREDAAVARAMPALFARHKAQIDFSTLQRALKELRHKHTGGFLMALAAELTSDRALKRQAQSLRDGRRHRLVEFFSPAARPKAAKDNYTLPIALDWRFHFPLPLADFPMPAKTR